jgi:DhnA family fructose-bisphosphate aldolase class Ia
VPVIIAGGPKMKSDLDVLETVEGAMGAGAKGVAIGRNVFQHESPTKITRAIARIVHEGWPAADALGELK